MIKSSNEPLDFLDFIGVAGFIIGYLNYAENVGQSDMQGAINDAINVIQDHLEKQDDKIDKLLSLIEDTKIGGEKVG